MTKARVSQGSTFELRHSFIMSHSAFVIYEFGQAGGSL
jgi:hypothetical protein